MAWTVASDISERLRELRAELKITQKSLADAVGRNVTAVSDWETGRNNRRPPRRVLERLAGIIGIPVVIFEEGGPRPGEFTPHLVPEHLPPSAYGASGRTKSEQIFALAMVELIGADVLEKSTREVVDRATFWLEELHSLRILRRNRRADQREPVTRQRAGEDAIVWREHPAPVVFIGDDRLLPARINDQHLAALQLEDGNREGDPEHEQAIEHSQVLRRERMGQIVRHQ